MSACLNIPNFAFLYTDFMIYWNTILVLVLLILWFTNIKRMDLPSREVTLIWKYMPPFSKVLLFTLAE